MAKPHTLPLLPSPPLSSLSHESLTRPSRDLPRLIASYTRSDPFRNGIEDLVLPRVGLDVRLILRRELQQPRIHSGKEADSLR